MDFLFYVLVGFIGQLVDGAIGMAYGLISTSIMLSHGVPAATASASVHAAEVFTTAMSGASHWRLGNINFQLIKRLAPAGMAGGALGAFVLTSVPNETIKMVVAAYLIIMGILILYKARKKIKISTKPPKYIPLLGFGGGFLDAIGGGGWGPLVTSNLLTQGTEPRIAIGSTSLTEFFVTATISAMFVFTIGLELWPIIGGLILGGVVAAPLAAYAAKKIPPRIIMIMVGLLIIGLSLRTFWML